MTKRMRRWMSVGAIIVLGFMTYAPNLTRLGLYEDDWRSLSEIAFDGALYQNQSGLRPLNLFVWNVGAKVFGLNIQAYLWSGVILYILSAVLLYLISILLSPSDRWIGLLITLLFLVYPSNYSHTWVTLWPHGGLVSLVIAGALCFVLFLQNNQAWLWLLSLLLFALSLNWYELQLGLIAGMPLLGVKDLLQGSPRRRVMILSPALLSAAFAVWWLVAHAWGEDYGVISPTIWSDFASQLLPRLWMSYRTLLVYSWTEPIRNLFPGAASRLQIMFVLVACAVINVVLYWVIVRLFRSCKAVPSNSKITPRPSACWWGALVSLVAIGLGMLPILPIGSPWIITLYSRDGSEIR